VSIISIHKRGGSYIGIFVQRVPIIVASGREIGVMYSTTNANPLNSHASRLARVQRCLGSEATVSPAVVLMARRFSLNLDFHSLTVRLRSCWRASMFNPQCWYARARGDGGGGGRAFLSITDRRLDSPWFPSHLL